MINEEITTYSDTIEKIINHLIKHMQCIPFDILELTGQESSILLYVFKNKNCTVTEIAEYFDVTLPAVMHRLSSLEKNGYIERFENENDKRVKYIGITEKGEQIIIPLWDWKNENLGKLLDFLGIEDTKNLIRIFLKIGDFLAQVKFNK